MNDNIRKILAESEAPDDVKVQAVILSIQLADVIISPQAKVSALGDGTFLAMLMKLLEMLLPYLLKILFPTT